MKPSKMQTSGTRVLIALGLFAVGVLALIVSLLLMFGWLVSEGPAPSTAHKLTTGCAGLVVLASSVSCFVLARRLMKSVSQNESHGENIR
jgi:hypothetical protein